MEHFLSIGGTGMLATATRSLAKRARAATIVARHPERLALSGNPDRVQRIAHDWNDGTGLTRAIESAIATHGAVDGALLWIHSAAASLVPPLLSLLANHRSDVRVVRVLGSAAGDPTLDRVARRRALLTTAGTPDLDLRDAILGYAGPSGATRWLTHEEISAGALVAFDGRDPITIVGRVEPWGERP